MLEVRNNEGVAVEELEYHDKLQAMCMLQRAVCWALAELTGNKVSAFQLACCPNSITQSTPPPPPGGGGGAGRGPPLCFLMLQLAWRLDWLLFR